MLFLPKDEIKFKAVLRLKKNLELANPLRQSKPLWNENHEDWMPSFLNLLDKAYI